MLLALSFPTLRLHTGAPDLLANHLLLVLPLPRGKRLPAGLPPLWRGPLQAWLARRGVTLAKLAGETCVLDDGAGHLASLCLLDPADAAFTQDARLCKALRPLLAEHPTELALVIAGFAAAGGAPDAVAARALYAAAVNAVPLPVRKTANPPANALKRLHLATERPLPASLRERAMVLAQANTLARSLTVLPPNELDPGAYRRLIRTLAGKAGWKHAELDMTKLRRQKAGAFVAVAQGSQPEDAAIVHLVHKPRGAQARVALVGKGICFDTGGHNLKSARYMYGMHEDMNGSAVALASFQALTALGLPLEVHCFLALAQNHLSAAAYKQNDVVTALNGTTIEIVHTDAEGRMVLADTLTLAAREKPDLVIDYATLTGSMVGALGTRCSGVFANRPGLEALARTASVRSGERVVCFPADEDYDALLDSTIADVKQCLQEGEADHILAARFLSRFVGQHDWLHVDLSSYRNTGGLGAVGTDVNGFGVAWTVSLLETWLEGQRPG